MQGEQYLKDLIIQNVFVTKGKRYSVTPQGAQSSWIFDFRRVLMRPQVLRTVSAIFLERFRGSLPFQIGGLEVAAIPLVTGLAMALSEMGTDVNAFFIRKSRKKYGLLQMVEGSIGPEKIILVDDLINTGKSFIRQVEVAEALGKKVHAVFTILRFRDESYYTYFRERGIQVVSIFTLDDFKDSLGLSLFAYKDDKSESPASMPFKTQWYFKSEGADFFHVIPKSRPLIDGERIYFGSDAGILWALNQKDGSVAWKRQVGLAPKAKHVFSSPALYNGVLYIGAHDGNFYAFNAVDGKKKWMFAEADWVHSSPCIAPDLGLVIVGLEFGWWRKTGGIVALDLSTGKKRWEYRIEGHAYASPTYSKKRRMILCGADNGTVYALDARTGSLLWNSGTGGEVRGRVAIADDRDCAVFGSFDSHMYVVRLDTGKIIHEVEISGGVWSDPFIYDGRAYVTSLDKYLYCIDIETGKVIWKYYARARIFSSPIFAEGKIYFGSNDARWYEIDPATGKETAFFQAVERITTAATYNPNTKLFFVPTFANEIYCLSRES